MESDKKKVVLIILDGWGQREETEFNAVYTAKTPNWDLFLRKYPNHYLKCSGKDVGLPEAQMGNSEVGHMHIGAGRLIEQDLTRINQSIADGQLGYIDILSNTFEQLKRSNGTLHLIGLCSEGGVHSHVDHLKALIDIAISKGVVSIKIHAILDGRDTEQKAAEKNLPELVKFLQSRPVAKIATIQGRYYAMDRNEKWERTALAYNLIMRRDAKFQYSDPLSALRDAYQRNETDEFVSPTSIVDGEITDQSVQNNDVGLFFNFRADRARQLTECLSARKFSKFSRGNSAIFSKFLTMTNYAEFLENPVIFDNYEIKNTLGEVISNSNKKQARIAETEKYAHVTFFLNGGREKPFFGEERILIPSPNVSTYDKAPEMSAYEVASRMCELITNQRHEAIIANFANADMVGHTGDFEAAVKAIEVLDQCLGKIHDDARNNGYDILITADHGNAELMSAPQDKSKTGLRPHTSHTNNVVPIVYIGTKDLKLESGDLKDIAPTMLTLLGLKVPHEMTGKNLLRR